MQLILFEDDAAARFHPLVYLKPVYHLQLGIRTLREKFVYHFAQTGIETPLTLHARRALDPVLREELPGTVINRFTDSDVLFLNGRVICDEAFARKVASGKFDHGKAYFNGAQLIAFRCNPSDVFENPPDKAASGSADEVASGSADEAAPVLPEMPALPDTIDAKRVAALPAAQVDCAYVGFVWDLIRLHPSEFKREARTLKTLGQVLGSVHPGAVLVNEKNIFIGEGATVKAGAVLDAEADCIAVGAGATVMPNAVLMNGVYLGENSTVKIGAKIYDHVFIGKSSKVGGEVEDSIIEKYANKAHDGFFGHSYLSSWCNLGADTNTSDLKNNYSTIRMPVRTETGSKEIDTKMMFLGLIMGEHSKCSINTMFNTGTVVGMSSNLFGSGFPPKVVGSFQWGGGEDKKNFVRFDLDKALDVARAVMNRRNIQLSGVYETLFRTRYAELTDAAK